MKHPKILILERDRKLATVLSPVAERMRWVLREVRSDKECVELLEDHARAVVVVKLGRDLDNEMRTVRRVSDDFPDARVVVVGDAVHANLSGLLWDFGASYVLLHPFPYDWLCEMVVTLMGERFA